MGPLPLPTQSLTWLTQAEQAGQRDAQVMLHLLNRADANDIDLNEFLDNYNKVIASLCLRLEALERTAQRLIEAQIDARGYVDLSERKPAPGPTPPPTASAGGLLEKVVSGLGPAIQAAMEGGTLPYGIAYAAISEVAAWLDTHGQHGCSALLREEIIDG